jgi:hypothetical protein
MLTSRSCQAIYYLTLWHPAKVESHPALDPVMLTMHQCGINGGRSLSFPAGR